MSEYLPQYEIIGSEFIILHKTITATTQENEPI